MADSWDDALEQLAIDAANWKSLRRERRRRDETRRAASPTRARKPRKTRCNKEEFKRLPLNPDERTGSVRRWRWDPALSPWWKLINRRGVRVEGSRAYCKFRKKFRLPLTEVEKLVAEAQSVKEFKDKPAGVGNGRCHARHPFLGVDVVSTTAPCPLAGACPARELSACSSESWNATFAVLSATRCPDTVRRCMK